MQNTSNPYFSTSRKLDFAISTNCSKTGQIFPKTPKIKEDFERLNCSIENLGSLTTLGSLKYNTNNLGPLTDLLKGIVIGQLSNESAYPQDMAYLLKAYFGLRIELSEYYLIIQKSKFTKELITNAASSQQSLNQLMGWRIITKYHE